MCYGTNLYFNNELVTEIVIPDTVTSIGNYAFYDCTFLTSIEIPDSVTSIGEYAFYKCTSLTSIEIPDSVTSIGNYVFYKCTSLTSIEIPDTVTSIGDYAFYNCTSLTSVEIGDSVTSIGSYAFRKCTSLIIYCEASSKPNGWNSYWNYSNRPVVWGHSGEEFTYAFGTNGGDEIEAIVSSIHITLPTPTKENYYFGGWYETSDFSGGAVISPYYGGKDLTLYAKWLTEEEYQELCDGTSFEKAIPIASGETIDVVIDTAGEYVNYKFVPIETKTYTISSSGSYDTYGYLYNASQTQIQFNDDGGSGTNFSISYSMTAGHTYYIAVRMYYSSTTGSFTITIN